ncbi:MAG: hypothetical protein EDS66_07375 [Planctomycetota bacterium]|nr:MAG: hypothetical protein EDS66_07375 [Planctomycetota bacterium]
MLLHGGLHHRRRLIQGDRLLDLDQGSIFRDRGFEGRPVNRPGAFVHDRAVLLLACDGGDGGAVGHAAERLARGLGNLVERQLGGGEARRLNAAAQDVALGVHANLDDPAVDLDLRLVGGYAVSGLALDLPDRAGACFLKQRRPHPRWRLVQRDLPLLGGQQRRRKTCNSPSTEKHHHPYDHDCILSLEALCRRRVGAAALRK